MLTQAGHTDLAASLETLNLEKLYFDLEELERRLTGIEHNLISMLRATASANVLSEPSAHLNKTSNHTEQR
jgi:hypothetical protein